MIPLIDLSVDKKLLSEIKKRVDRVINSKSFILGVELSNFETRFAKFMGTRFAVGVASGTDALRISLRALGIKPGDKVLTVSLTSPFTALAILEEGAIPVFCDVDEKTWTMDIGDCAKRMDKKVKAIMPVHIYGNPANMEAVGKFAKKFKLSVVEDSCQAHGALYKNKRMGHFGDIAAFSFYPTKNLGAFGDGGAIVTNNKRLADLVKLLRHGGQRRRFWHEFAGMNSRLDELQAAILTTRLKFLRKHQKDRAKIVVKYKKELKDIPLTFQEIHENAIHGDHLFVVRLDRRNQLHEHLKKLGIVSDIYYPHPVHLQPAFIKYARYKLSVTEKLSSELLALPLYPHLSAKDQDVVIRSVRSFFKNV